MSSPPQQTADLVSSDRIHNKNCFNYLNQLKIPETLLKSLPQEIQEKMSHVIGKNPEDYDSTYAYADLYTELLGYIEENINTLYDKTRHDLLLDHARIAAYQEIPEQSLAPALDRFTRRSLQELGVFSSIKDIKDLTRKKEKITEEVDALDDFIFSLYANDNHILEETFEAIKDITSKQTPVSGSIEKSITERVRDKKASVNHRAKSPAYEGSAVGRFTAMMSDNYKPQHGTSLSTVRHYSWNEQSGVREYRFGTQGQRHQGEVRTSPLFERFLKVQAEREQDKDHISHIYFNNLGRDRTGAEGSKEKALTYALERLEQDHPNVAVITLPADKGLMQGHDFKKIKPIYDTQTIKDEFLSIASERESGTQKIKDFHISPSIRRKIFCDENGRYSPEIEAAKLSALIQESFVDLGYQNKEQLSPAERQAVWFHFIKFNLTNHIIETLQPNSMNFSCKDAIDRGGVSSAYYNLVKSFASDHPMNPEEFNRALHAAPTMVKGRGMNHHLNMIWNTVDAYVDKNYELLKKDPEKAWLIEWRDFNCPHKRVENLLQKRIEQSKHDIEQFKQEIEEIHLQHPEEKHERKLAILQKGLDALTHIEKQKDLGVSGKRLLLESVTRTASLAIKQNDVVEADINSYTQLAEKLSINYPKLQVVAGAMKVFAGALLSVLTLGQVKKFTGMYSEGIATIHAATQEGLDSRRSLQAAMKEQIDHIRHPTVEEPSEEHIERASPK